MMRNALMPGSSDNGNWPLFRWIVFTHLVLCSFVGMFTFELFLPLLFGEVNLVDILHVQGVLSALANGGMVAALTWLFHFRRGRRIRKGKSPFDAIAAGTKYRIFATSFAFACGSLEVLLLLVNCGPLVFTIITLVMLVLHVRRFLRKIAQWLKPDCVVTWPDVGYLVHVYATTLAAFTLVLISLNIIHGYVDGAGPAIAIPKSQPGMINALYFSVVVMTTLGFGDIVPLTPDAKMVVALQCLTSYIMFALMIGILMRGIVSGDDAKDNNVTTN